MNDNSYQQYLAIFREYGFESLRSLARSITGRRELKMHSAGSIYEYVQHAITDNYYETMSGPRARKPKPQIAKAMLNMCGNDPRLKELFLARFVQFIPTIKRLEEKLAQERDTDDTASLDTVLLSASNHQLEQLKTTAKKSGFIYSLGAYNAFQRFLNTAYRHHPQLFEEYNQFTTPPQQKPVTYSERRIKERHKETAQYREIFRAHGINSRNQLMLLLSERPELTSSNPATLAQQVTTLITRNEYSANNKFFVRRPNPLVAQAILDVCDQDSQLKELLLSRFAPFTTTLCRLPNELSYRRERQPSYTIDQLMMTKMQEQRKRYREFFNQCSFTVQLALYDTFEALLSELNTRHPLGAPFVQKK